MFQKLKAEPGRILSILIEAGAVHMIALEPYDTFKVTCRNIRNPEKVACLKTIGD